MLEDLSIYQKFEMVGFFTDDLPAASALLRHYSELEEGDSDESIWSFFIQLWPKIKPLARQKFLGAILGPERTPPPIAHLANIPVNFFESIRDNKYPHWLELLSEK